MSGLTRLKIALALIGLILFGGGVRFQHDGLRWSGIAFVAAAWFLRFAKPRRSAGPPP